MMIQWKQFNKIRNKTNGKYSCSRSHCYCPHFSAVKQHTVILLKPARKGKSH